MAHPVVIRVRPDHHCDCWLSRIDKSTVLVTVTTASVKEACTECQTHLCTIFYSFLPLSSFGRRRRHCLRCISGSHSAVQNMIESRICPKASPTLYKRLRYLWVQGQDFDWKPLDEVLKTSEMAYSLNCQWNGRRGSASGWPEGETRLVRGSQLCYTAISNSEMRIIGIAYRYLNMF